MVKLKTWAAALASALMANAAGDCSMPTINGLQDLWADRAVGSGNLGLAANFIEV